MSHAGGQMAGPPGMDMGMQYFMPADSTGGMGYMDGGGQHHVQGAGGQQQQGQHPQQQQQQQQQQQLMLMQVCGWVFFVGLCSRAFRIYLAGSRRCFCYHLGSIDVPSRPPALSRPFVHGTTSPSSLRPPLAATQRNTRRLL